VSSAFGRTGDPTGRRFAPDAVRREKVISPGPPWQFYR
jgi:hypothetical protein